MRRVGVLVVVLAFLNLVPVPPAAAAVNSFELVFEALSAEMEMPCANCSGSLSGLAQGTITATSAGKTAVAAVALASVDGVISASDTQCLGGEGTVTINISDSGILGVASDYTVVVEAAVSLSLRWARIGPGVVLLRLLEGTTGSVKLKTSANEWIGTIAVVPAAGGGAVLALVPPAQCLLGGGTGTAWGAGAGSVAGFLAP